MKIWQIFAGIKPSNYGLKSSRPAAEPLAGSGSLPTLSFRRVTSE